MKNASLLLIVVVLLATATKGQKGKTYYENQLQTLRLPMGGIGTGNILMGGRGNIEFIEVFNRPDRKRRLEKTFFALWMQKGDSEPIAKILERELFPPYLESTHKYVAGLPRFQEATFTNNFPFADWQLQDPDIPLHISLSVVSPFVPLDVKSSSYPIVAFYWEVKNTADEAVSASIVLNMENPIRSELITNISQPHSRFRSVQFRADQSSNINYQGGMYLATTAMNGDIQTHWYPGQWRDETHVFWDDFKDDGRIEPKEGDWRTTYQPTAYNETTRRMASNLVHFNLKPGETVKIPFYLSWYFPKREFGPAEVFGVKEAANKTFSNAYSNSFVDERDVLLQFLENEQQLLSQSRTFGQAIHSSTYPTSVIEALTTQAASIRTNLIQVTDKGNVHGFEGVLTTGWCCPGTCTHVWNYEQSLASLFPSLERNMRNIEFLHDTFENGFQTHRSVFPVGEYWFDGPAAADGHMGTIVRAYREWKLSGDSEWLARIWPKIKKALEFAWTGPGKVTDPRFKYQEKQMAWDPNKSGMLSGRQHNTYDISFFGPSSMTTSIYLAALKACSEMAMAMGEKDKSKQYRQVFERGSKLAADSLWNGSYFIQIIVEDPGLEGSDDYELTPEDPSGNRIPKYQYGDGCLSDQLLGQYLGFISGLGYIMDQSKVDAAIKSVYDHNFIQPLRTFANVQRVYGLNDEGGLVLCTWPNGNRPALPFVYADEIWTGVEYQVASSLIFSGYVEEGLQIVEAVQNRYDGFRRNPFEHDESGVHYARAMASWSLLLALSGIEYDGVSQTLAFDPKIKPEDFRTFWSTGGAWGEVKIVEQQAVLEVVYGQLELQKFEIKGKKSETFKKGKSLSAGEELVLEWD